MVNWEIKIYVFIDIIIYNWNIVTNIYWPCYCTAHGYIFIHSCDIIWSFGVEADPVIKRGVLGSHYTRHIIVPVWSQELSTHESGYIVLFVQCSTGPVVICFSFQIYLRNLVSLIVVLPREIITYSTNCWQTQSLNITVSNQCLHRKLHNDYSKNRRRM